MTVVHPHPLLVFDGDCAFCTSSVRRLESWFPGSFDAVPYQRADLRALGLDEAQCQARLQWLGVDANRASGARAVGELLRHGARTTTRRLRPGESALWSALAFATRVPPASWAAAGVYAVVATNRHRLPGGTPACRM